MNFFSEIRDFDRIRDFLDVQTSVRISLSRAKFDVEADFEVRSAVAPPKPCQISEKRNFRSEIFVEKKFSASKREMSGIVRNAFWQSLATIRAKFDELRKNFT